MLRRNSLVTPKGNPSRRLSSTLASQPTTLNKKSDSGTTLNKCYCCGTILSYTGTASKFRCSICDASNIAELPPRNEELHVLSYTHVRKLIDSCLLEAQIDQSKSIHQVFIPLCDYLHKGFKSHHCLNNSFKLKKSSKHLHYSSSNINLESIREFFNLLLRLPTKRPLYSALSGASEGLKRVYMVQADQDDPRAYLHILILLEIPFLSKCLVDTADKVKPQSMVDVPEIRALCYDILKRCLGILAQCQTPKSSNYYASWFSKFTTNEFTNRIDLINLYITFQLKKYFYQANNPLLVRSKSVTIPSRTHPTDIEYHETSMIKNELEELSNWIVQPFPVRSKSRKRKDESKIKVNQYGNDWHIKTAAVVLSTFIRAGTIRKEKVPVSTFYNSLVDYVDIRLDFDSWQAGTKKSHTNTNPDIADLQTVIEYIHGSSRKLFERASFYYCQFPFLISLGGKISILEYEARRQMERKAEEAFINSLDKRIAIDVYFKVRVRRDHIVQDSLTCVKANPNNLKKSLRVQFVNEPGVDAGGLKKEWFLILTKAIYHPQTGMLYNAEDSNLLWFNVKPIDNFEMYYLFGVVLGLAIYNSTILDLNFPLALYKVLLEKPLDLGDYEQLYPLSYKNLIGLKSFSAEELKEMDLTFEVNYKDVFGITHTDELVLDGSRIAVNIENLGKYIEKYCYYFLCDGIRRQLQEFARGFTSVVGGNGLSLFLPEEIQLLLCGSEEKVLDIEILRSITKYVGWDSVDEAKESTIVQWFWEYMEQQTLVQQKKILMFVTGSDRVPATGIQNMSFKISLLDRGKDSDRLPVAHTCFNELALYKYATREKFRNKLEMAVNESAGFGIR